MYLIKCTVNRKDLFQDKVLNFSRAITIISGRNNSGKSLLSRILLDTLVSGNREERILSTEEWNRIQLQLILSHNKQDLTIDAVGDTFQAKNDNTVTTDHFLSQNYNSQYILSSCFIPSATDLDGTLTLNYKTTKNILLNDGSSFYSHHTYLKNQLNGEEKLKELQSTITKDIRAIDRQRELCDLGINRTEKLIKEKKIIKQEIDTLNKNLSTLLKKNYKLMKIQEDLDRIEILGKELRSIKEKLASENDKIAEIADIKSLIKKRFPQFTDIDKPNTQRLEHLQGVYTEIRNLNEKIDGFNSRISKMKRNIKRFLYLFNAAAAGGLAAIFYKNNLSPWPDLHLIQGIMATVAIITPSTLLYSLYSPGMKEPTSLKEKKEILEKKLKPFLNENGLDLVGYKLSEIYEFLLQYFEDFIEYAETKRDLDEKKESLVDSGALKKIEEKLEALKINEECLEQEIKANLQFIDDKSLIEPQSYLIQNIIQDNDAEIRSAERKVINKEEILTKIETEINQTRLSNFDENKLLDKRNDLENKSHVLNMRQSVLNSTRIFLAKAVKNRETEQLEQLVHKTLNLFNELTNNTFKETIHPDILRKLITFSELPVDIKQNIRHELILALKISLTDFLVDAGINLPLIIDDPFLFMDNARINHLKTVLSQVSQRRQIIIFTHQENLQNWGHFETL